MGSLSIATSQPIGVLVADSNHIHCQLLVDALRRRSDFVVSSCPTDLDAMVSAVNAESIDVVLVRVDEDPGMLRSLHLAHPHIAKVLLLEEAEREAVVSAFRAGARGVFELTDASLRTLCKCILRVHQGQIWANNEQLIYLIEALADTRGLRIVDYHGARLLTQREEQIVSLVADGLPNREIAIELGLSENTIKKYLFCIFDKVGVSTRVELVLYAVSHGVTQQVERLPS